MNEDKKLKYLRELEKLKASKVKSDDYTSPLDQDVMKVEGKPAAKEPVTRLKGMTDKIDTRSGMKEISGSDFAAKIAALTKGGGKKVLGALPMVGAGMAALQGDPAMAAEELISDLPGGELLRSEPAGNRPEEVQMLKERDLKGSGPKYVPPEGLEEAKSQRNVFTQLMKLIGK